MVYGEEVKKEESTMNFEDEIKYLQRRMDNFVDSMYNEHKIFNKKIKIIIAILVEKKLIGDAMMKAIEETFPEEKVNAKSLIDWLFEK